MKRMTFDELPIGGRFVFLGNTYKKSAPGLADGEKRTGHMFQQNYEVELIIENTRPPMVTVQ
jgi:hypothetical protein